MAYVGRRFAHAGVVLALALSACSRTGPAQDIDVGSMRISARVPEHPEVKAEKDGVAILVPTERPSMLHELPVIHLRDLGPVTPEGLHREMSGLREQWLQGQGAAVQARMKALTPVHFLLRVPLLSRDFSIAWQRLLTASKDAPYDQVAAYFTTMLGTLDQSLALEMPAITDWALPYVEPRTRREIASRKLISVDKREAEEIETRDQVNDNGPRRLLFVVNDGHLLVVWSGIYDQDKSLDAYEMLRSSIRFPKSEGKK